MCRNVQSENNGKVTATEHWAYVFWKNVCLWVGQKKNMPKEKWYS